MAQTLNLPKVPSKGLRIIPFGGCGYFGMNITAYILNDHVFLVDAGSQFPASYQSGVNSVVPNLDTVMPELGKLRAYFITHGHEDHIGALPYLYKKHPAPIYAPKWATMLLLQKFEEHQIDPSVITEVQPGDKIRYGDMSVEWVHLNHSIPNACGLHICTKDIRVFHSGDFKIEFDPLYEPPANLGRLKQIGELGVDLLLADSTNANKEGLCPPERITYDALKKAVEQATGAVVVSTFSSNLWRVAIIARVCKELDKKICLMGRGVNNTLELSQRLGTATLDKSLFIDEEQLSRVDKDNLVIIATGCQGERFAALARIANLQVRNFRIAAEDTVILSSRIIPGNEADVIKIINKFEKIGCTVITAYENPDIHVSGHGYKEDLSILCQSLKPKHFLPVHGTFFHLKKNAKIYSQYFNTSIPHIPDSGDVFDLKKDEFDFMGNIAIENLFIDSFSNVPLPYLELKRRLNIGEQGLFVFSSIYNSVKNEWHAEPIIEWFGLALPEAIDTKEWSQKLKRNLLAELKSTTNVDASERARIYIRNLFYSTIRKKPIVVANIHTL